MPKWPRPPLGKGVSECLEIGGVGGSAAVRRVTYTPRMATFFPGPIFARTRGLQTVIPAHIIGPASFVSIFSGIWNVKYSCALTWLAYPPCAIVPSSYGAP